MTKKNEPLSFGERLRAIRLSLSGGAIASEVPTSAMDRVMFRTDTRHRWRRLELAAEPGPKEHELVKIGVHNLVSLLDVDKPDKVAEQLIDYAVNGKGHLPWTTAPAWKGEPPLKRSGREPGSRVIGAANRPGSQFLARGSDLPPEVKADPSRLIPTASGTSPVPSAAAATLVQAIGGGEVNEAALNTILEQVAKGAMTPAAATVVIKVLVASGGGGSGGLGAVGGRPQTAHKPTALRDLTHSVDASFTGGSRRNLRSVWGYDPRSDSRSESLVVAQRPLPRELVAQVFDVMPSLPPEAREIVRECIGFKASVSKKAKAL